ncbi:hypothetical protein [Mucilaginibacter sp. FT3.2]|uniref:hypothetical protein n=1 Tax=Mucilaginibacter sp. FT3.2 TaxID=2723090 RepID=UPI00161E3B49|nr:hypothetical protein [Mucilaginibacter sp. FT3.2]MBB6231908.1 hypothetical protein [Mucilaginibacter sp. FT3.2]
MLTETRNISPEKAAELLKKNGVDVTIDEAQTLLEFIYLMANIFVGEIVEK